jgi:CBS domain-containing protein
MPIIDDNDVVIGMITVVDLLHAVSDGKDLETMLARDLMTKNPLVVTQDTKVEDIVDIMYKNGLEIIPVVDKQADSRLIGIVSSSDTLTEKMNEFLQ